MKTLGKVMAVVCGFFTGYYFLGNPSIPWLIAAIAISSCISAAAAFMVKE